MYLGQHFLKNKNQLKKITAALELESGDIVIEIGPGHGELTEKLKAQSSKIKVVAIEKDTQLASSLELLALRNKWHEVDIIKGDALKVLPEITKRLKLKPYAKGGSASGRKSYKLTGNIPYYITGHLFRVIGELTQKPELVVFTIQKEVAERICALRQAQGKATMNLLAASIQFWAEPQIIGFIPRRDFRPEPKVDSSIIKLKVQNSQLKSDNNYYKFIRILFKQPRKTISNNLRLIEKKSETRDEKIKKAGVNPTDRPQDLSIAQVIELSKNF